MEREVKTLSIFSSIYFHKTLTFDKKNYTIIYVKKHIYYARRKDVMGEVIVMSLGTATPNRFMFLKVHRI